MSAPTNNPPSSADPGQSTIAIERLIMLIDELLAVVGEENHVLATGFPASLSKQTARKNELADQFDRWVKEVAAQPFSIRVCAPDLQGTLMARLARLRTIMDENIDRLRAAMEASQRRVEAVMMAIRGDIAAASPYCANGRVQNDRVRGMCTNLSVHV
jgi:hypothetical protein